MKIVFSNAEVLGVEETTTFISPTPSSIQVNSALLGIALSVLDNGNTFALNSCLMASQLTLGGLCLIIKAVIDLGWWV